MKTPPLSATTAASTDESRTARTPRLHAFTVDVEDYYQVDAFSDRIARADWPFYSSRVVENTRFILRILAERGIQGTFYVLGYVARQHPELVLEIQRGGHEVGCHGYGHQSLYRMTPDEFRTDLLLATDILSDIAGERMTTYRAPNFSIRNDTLWALDVLVDAGYLIDSSIFPVVHDRYGIPDAERAPHLRTLSLGSIWEFPPSVYRSFLGNVPIAGGGYFRLLPFSATRWFMRRTVERDGLPLMFYIHPWEVDPNQPRIPCSLKSQFRHYQNLRTTARKLERLIDSFSFGTVTAALRAADVGFDVPQLEAVSVGESLQGPHTALHANASAVTYQD